MRWPWSRPKPTPPTTTEPAEPSVDALMNELVELHNAEYHPGLECAANTQWECLDRFGGEPRPGPFGHHVPLGSTRRLI